MLRGVARGGRVCKMGRGATLRSQSRVFVKRLHDYFMKEKDNNGMLLPANQVQQRVADALQIGRNTVSRIVKVNVEENQTPGKKRSRPSPKSALGRFDEIAIRNHIYEYYFRKEVPTRTKLIASLEKAELFTGSTFTLSRILKNLGFEWKTINNKKFLMERYDIVSWRCEFLRKIRSKSIEKLVFIDETWINAGHPAHKASDKLAKSSRRKEPTGKCKRLILTHAGRITGFVPGAMSLFRSVKQGDYHNATTFQTWFKDLLVHIPSGCTILINNALYHSQQLHKAITSNSTKVEILNWLKEENIDFDIALKKAELLKLVESKKYEKTCVLDKLAEEKGHEVLILPPYHSQFNPIGLIWAQIKGEVERKNKTFTIEEVR